MERINVDAVRDSVPDWARQPVTMADKITEKQRTYLLSLVDRKQIPANQEAVLDNMMKALRISEDPEEFGMSKKQASILIEWFLGRPNKDVSARRPDKTRQERPRVSDVVFGDVPAGRYAVNSNEGELRFYQVWRPKDNPAVFKLYVLHGPDSSAVQRSAVIPIMAKISADVRAAAIRYGLEIGSCSNCGRRLTNRISRELGIGPVCGGRMFGDDFSDMVNDKRAEIVGRGQDPDEELS